MSSEVAGRRRRSVAHFVGTGTFVSFLTGQGGRNYSAAMSLFEDAEAGTLKLETNELAVAEVARVLEELYGMSRAGVAEVVTAILGTKNLKVAGSALLEQAAHIYSEGDASFQDAYDKAFIEARGLYQSADESQGEPKKARS